MFNDKPFWQYWKEPHAPNPNFWQRLSPINNMWWNPTMNNTKFEYRHNGENSKKDIKCIGCNKIRTIFWVLLWILIIKKIIKRK